MKQLVMVARALADPSRVRVLMALRGRELCVCELCDALALTQSTLSTHLQVIRKAGLVSARKQGKWMYYAIAPEAGRLVRALFQHFSGSLKADATLKRDAKNSGKDSGCATRVPVVSVLETRKGVARIMKLSELKSILNQHPTARLRFVLPNGASVPSHAHVTEVARIDKRFIDCGGTLRQDSLCRLQTWSSDDTDHRLTAGKLTKILDKAGSVLGAEDLEVDIEHQAGFISQFPLKSAGILPDEIVFHLTERDTVCLAEDKCKPPGTQGPLTFNPLQFNPHEAPQPSNCCGNR